jgi:transcriptional regulator with XRE-family HTH domain
MRAKAQVPEERRIFAARLKELRFLRGHHTAKKFAQALGIEQNTYTRYERAEVEPSLTVIDSVPPLERNAQRAAGLSDRRQHGAARRRSCALSMKRFSLIRWAARACE